MPFRNCFLLLTLIVSYSLCKKNTVSIFILDSNNKLDSAWLANRYTQVVFTPIMVIKTMSYLFQCLIYYLETFILDGVSVFLIAQIQN